MKNRNVLVYISEDKLAPKGGPAAVCYYYQQEQKKQGDHFFEFLPCHKAEGENNESKHLRIIDDLHSLGAALKMMLLKPRKVKIDMSSYDIIHFHSTDALYQARTSLESFKGIVILQSHSPEPRGREMFASLPKWIRMMFPFLKRGYEQMDRYAFEHADYILFPCSDAEEPYFHVWPYYKKIHVTKKNSYRYVLTGIPEAKANRTREQVLEELNIPKSSFIISYVGRHNQIKGYDLFKKIGGEYIKQDESAWVVCAGKETPIKGLIHERWKEVGWTTDPHSYIGASDVFVLPNRETYFDIIMMELLSLGKIVIASNTGGNKWFSAHKCQGVFLYNSIDEAISLIKKVRNLTKEERKRLEEANQKFYRENLTVECMYNSYIKLLNEF